MYVLSPRLKKIKNDLLFEDHQIFYDNLFDDSILIYIQSLIIDVTQLVSR